MTNSINKIALVTGGSRGLGKDMALSLAKKGIDVVLTYRSNEAEANEVANTIKAGGGHAAVLQLDMAKFETLDVFKFLGGQILPIRNKKLNFQKFETKNYAQITTTINTNN